MKSRFRVYSVLVLGIVIALVALWSAIHRQKKIRPEVQIGQALHPFTNNIYAPNAVVHSNAVSGPTKSFGSSQTNLKSQGERRAEMIEQALEQRNIPIEFYGVIIDENSNVLPGVEVRIYIRHWELTQNAMSVPVYLTERTGADGRFEISGETGDALDVESLRKAGYEPEPGLQNFGPTGSSFGNPVVFKMWNTNIHEQLVTGEKSFHIVPDGRPYFILLADGTISESGPGDLRVSVKRPEQITYGMRYNWSSKINVINGGLQAASDYAMWMAPADGYITSFRFNQTVGSGWGDSTGKRRFYITLNNGREYGRITIELYAYYNNQIPGLIRLSYAINPSGSRILR